MDYIEAYDDWQALAQLYQRTGFDNKSPERLARLFQASQYKLFGLDQGQLVAAARAFSDGGDCAVIADVAVLPPYHGEGLGRELVRHLLAMLPQHERVLLFCLPDRMPFYRQLGFVPMTTALCLFRDPQQARTQGLID
ncbi:GNAT family N-acetyltransferase [Ferrimonas marina]|uniref:Acetyltransferase (GNAT) domain-containing protein n=1 Tax=Ferrimonas marina TaxID=299255 RepID=A0A1M5VTF7_9GAMM|nr:GNAT family N-acetyltransferase [Ferrimonas marina]SHH78470.1 Acetyltransferase (GNAT) domain-containing protein [Ferrimonas marina]